MNNLSEIISSLMLDSIESGASLTELTIIEDKKKDLYSIEISDNRNTNNNEQCQAKDCLSELAAKTEGEISDTVEASTHKLLAKFRYSSPERPKLGDIAEAWTSVIKENPTIRMKYVHDTYLGTFDIDTQEVKSDLEGLPINDSDILKELKELIIENLEMIEADL